MALKYGIPPGNPTVVWDDVKNVPGTVTNDPYVSWQYHLNRTNGRGGVDMTARWVPVYAPMDCHVEHYTQGAGIAVRMWAADGSGWSDVFDHLSSIAVGDGTFVPYGGRVGTSGDTGDVPPHLHWHRIDPSGTRRIPWDYFTDGTTTPSTGDDDMPSEAWLNGLGQSIINAIRADINWINQGSGNPRSLQAIKTAVDGGRDDLNYVHQVSPYSLKNIRQTQLAGSGALRVAADEVEPAPVQLASLAAAIRALPAEERDALVEELAPTGELAPTEG